MAESKPILRQWSLLVALSARRRGMTIREMADDHGVTQRTIRRDLESPQRAGFPLEEETSEHGRKHWTMRGPSSAPPIAFTWDEAIAFFLARRHLEPLAGTPLWDSALRAFRKIRATLSDSAVRYLDKMSRSFHRTTVGSGEYSEKGELIDRLMMGIEDRRITFIEYQSVRATEPVTYEIYPYGIVFHRHSLYVVAHSVSHEELRHFKVDRLSGVQLEQLKFTRPDGFDLHQHLADSFGIYRGDGKPQRIRVRFSPAVAMYVKESHWHDSQTIKKQRDGSLLFEVTLGSTEEIKSWTLSFGRHAEVLEPEALREEIAEEISAMQRAYTDTSPRQRRSRSQKG